VVEYLAGPKNAHDIEVTGVHRERPPLSPSDLPYPADELPTWAESLIPAGFHEALAVALFEPDGRHVGFLALLSGSREPPTSSARRRLAKVTSLLAQGIDPMRALAESSRLVSDAFAGVLLFHDGRTGPVPGLAADSMLARHSALLTTVGARVMSGEVHLSFLWPRNVDGPTPGHVRVTYLAVTDSPLPDVHGIVLLSSVGAVHGLTSRELEVLGMIVDGCSNQQIAHQLVVTTRTVATHVEHILAKLASPTRTLAAVLAQREGLYVPTPHPP
jgi:DNA-binding CsgD family transcriptional regulator